VGAALQAEALTQGSDTLLLDVVPLSLGLETMGGVVEKLIQRNTPIPACAAQEFTTYQDGQSAMQIHVLQGEREMARQNRSLAYFEMKGIPPLPAGIARIAVRFAVDADGLLSVSAQELTTGVRQSVEVRPSYGLPPEEIERMLLESMRNAREDITERLLAEARVEAERAIIELESAMRMDAQMVTEEEKTLFTSQIRYLREAIAEEDRDRIDVEIQELARISGPFAERRMNKAIASALQGKSVDQV
jgi:molecular chaperone HscA